jgi:hypothetical protein
MEVLTAGLAVVVLYLLTLAIEPSAFQLRYLQTATEIAAEHNSTTIFPIPIELFRPFIQAAATGVATPAQD